MELTRNAMLDYLREPKKHDCTVRFHYATTVQKSYGFEKRYFIPAPMIVFEGEGWSQHLEQFYQFLDDKCRSQGIKTPLLPRPSIEGTVKVYSTKYEEASSFFFKFVKDENIFFARNLFARHSENCQHVKMSFSLTYSTGEQLGCFFSRPIKVISKPSTAKNSANSCMFKFLSVSSGQTVCLSNRLKTPPITRFLTTGNNQFCFESQLWTPLMIHLIDLDCFNEDLCTFIAKDGPICYGDIIRLSDLKSALSLPKLRICKVKKNMVIFPDYGIKRKAREVVNQMQKVALQVVDEEGFTYIKLCDQNNIELKTIVHMNNVAELELEETALFNIVCTVENEFKFYKAMGHTVQDVLPAPVVEGIGWDFYLIFAGESALNERPNYITGSCFTDNLAVWLGTIKCVSTLRSAELIEFEVPPLAAIENDTQLLMFCDVQPHKIVVPILLVRNDGVIYPTGLAFAYYKPQIVSNLNL